MIPLLDASYPQNFGSDCRDLSRRVTHINAVNIFDCKPGQSRGVFNRDKAAKTIELAASFGKMVVFETEYQTTGSVDGRWRVEEGDAFNDAASVFQLARQIAPQTRFLSYISHIPPLNYALDPRTLIWERDVHESAEIHSGFLGADGCVSSLYFESEDDLVMLPMVQMSATVAQKYFNAPRLAYINARYSPPGQPKDSAWHSYGFRLRLLQAIESTGAYDAIVSWGAWNTERPTGKGQDWWKADEEWSRSS